MEDNTETKDLYLAALWYAKGIRLLNVRREGPQCWFVFADKQKCQSMETDYYSQTEIVIAKTYADAVRTLKSLVFH